MMGFGSMMLFGGLFFIALLVLVFSGAAWLVITLARGNQSQVNTQPQVSLPAPGQTPLDILKTRYAKGEITKEQFDAMKHDLGA